MSYIRRVAKGTAVVFVMMLATGVLGYLFRLLLAKNLSIEDFGLFFAVFAFVNLFYGFKSFGLGAAVVPLRELFSSSIASIASSTRMPIVVCLEGVIFGVL